MIGCGLAQKMAEPLAFLTSACLCEMIGGQLRSLAVHHHHLVAGEGEKSPYGCDEDHRRFDVECCCCCVVVVVFV